METEREARLCIDPTWEPDLKLLKRLTESGFRISASYVIGLPGPELVVGNVFLEGESEIEAFLGGL